MLAADSVDSELRFSIDWFERKGAYAIVKSEYADLLRETAEAISRKAYASQKAFTREHPAARVSLTRDQIRDLASRYDAGHMSREEYDAFLEDLCALGVITEEDKPYLNASKFPGMTRLDHLNPSAVIQPGGPAASFSEAFSSSGGRVLDWARYHSTFQYYNDDTRSWEPTRRAVLFGRIAGILQEAAG